MPVVGVTVSHVGIVVIFDPPLIAIVHETFEVIAKVSAQALKVGNAIIVLETLRYDTGAAGCVTNTVFERLPEVTTTKAYLAAVVELATAAIFITALLLPEVGVTVIQVGIEDIPPGVETPDIVTVQVTFDVTAKVSAQALYVGNATVVLDTFR